MPVANVEEQLQPSPATKYVNRPWQQQPWGGNSPCVTEAQNLEEIAMRFDTVKNRQDVGAAEYFQFGCVVTLGISETWHG